VGTDYLGVKVAPDGTAYLTIYNQATYTGSGGTADLYLSRDQVTALAAYLVQALAGPDPSYGDMLRIVAPVAEAPEGWETL
jgi:hypothetical protein